MQTNGKHNWVVHITCDFIKIGGLYGCTNHSCICYPTQSNSFFLL